MNEYRVVVSFVGAIDVEVTAKDETDARTQADEIVRNMDNSEFIEKLDPQFAGYEVLEQEIEIKEDKKGQRKSRR